MTAETILLIATLLYSAVMTFLWLLAGMANQQMLDRRPVVDVTDLALAQTPADINWGAR